MNKPKYNFGEKVSVTGISEPCDIKSIKLVDGGYAYWLAGVSHAGTYEENVIKPYQEPKKKKLYAWVDNQEGEARFFINDDNHGWKDCRRMPEYDIEYKDEQ